MSEDRTGGGQGFGVPDLPPPVPSAENSSQTPPQGNSPEPEKKLPGYSLDLSRSELPDYSSDQPQSGIADYAPGDPAIPPAPRGPGELPARRPATRPHIGPAEERKSKLDDVFFILGLLTPWAGILFLTSFFASLAAFFASALAWVIAALGTVTLLAAWVIGRFIGNNRLRSWGLGGLFSEGIIALGAMLLFGSCWFLVGGYF